MLFRKKKFILSLAAFLILAIYQQIAGPRISDSLTSKTEFDVQGIETKREEARVTRVVDGDTVEVLLNDKKQKVRVIGINTPETVDPRRPVQCFGKEASNYAKEILTGQNVSLESDSTQADHDSYGRLLRYIWVDNDKTDFGQKMIANGYAYEYTYDLPYKYQAEYKNAQNLAREEKRGLWNNSSCPHGSS